MSEVTLRKYKNRRLYDVKKSEYVRVDEVRRRVIDGEQVVTQGDNQDVTAEVLVQIIQADVLKRRPGTYPTAEALRRFIRSYLT
jgi:polyhydroxyalkanoate synthesis regulator protein